MTLKVVRLLQGFSDANSMNACATFRAVSTDTARRAVPRRQRGFLFPGTRFYGRIVSDELIQIVFVVCVQYVDACHSHAFTNHRRHCTQEAGSISYPASAFPSRYSKLSKTRSICSSCSTAICMHHSIRRHALYT